VGQGAADAGEALMLVNVVRLRSAGAQLYAQAVKDAAPMRGELSIIVEQWRPTWAPSSPYVRTRFAKLRAPGALPDETLLAPLRDGRIERLAGDSFVVFGTEDGISLAAEHPQAWCCRLARPE
jgi:hypothetical protein